MYVCVCVCVCYVCMRVCVCVCVCVCVWCVCMCGVCVCVCVWACSVDVLSGLTFVNMWCIACDHGGGSVPSLFLCPPWEMA